MNCQQKRVLNITQLAKQAKTGASCSDSTNSNTSEQQSSKVMDIVAQYVEDQSLFFLLPFSELSSENHEDMKKNEVKFLDNFKALAFLFNNQMNELCADQHTKEELLVLVGKLSEWQTQQNYSLGMAISEKYGISLHKTQCKKWTLPYINIFLFIQECHRGWLLFTKEATKCVSQKLWSGAVTTIGLYQKRGQLRQSQKGFAKDLETACENARAEFVKIMPNVINQQCSDGSCIKDSCGKRAKEYHGSKSLFRYGKKAHRSANRESNQNTLRSEVSIRN